MVSARLWFWYRRFWTVSQRLAVLLGLAMLLSQCSSDGESGRVSPPPAQNPALERQAIVNLLDLYRTAVLQEDIDRLQELLQPDNPGIQQEHDAAPQAETVPGVFADTVAFRQTMARTFQTSTVTALEMPPDEVVIAADRRRVTFQEIESVEDLTTPGQHTSVFRTTFTLQQEEQDGIVTVRIAAVTREGPLIRVTTPGQVVTATPARLDVSAPTGAIAIARVDVSVPETRAQQTLRDLGAHFTGAFIPPQEVAPQPLSIRVTDRTGQRLIVPHRYRPRLRNAAVAYRIDVTDTTPLPVSAVAIDPETSTIWFGGESVSAGSEEASSAGTLVRVAADGQVLLRLEPAIAPRLPAGAVAHIEDLAFDALGRLHAVFLQVRDAQQPDAIVRNGVLVLLDANQREIPEGEAPCQTVDPFDDAYPLRVPRVQGQGQVASPSARVTLAKGGAVWLFGSDGGVARVTDNYRTAPCPGRLERVEVQYAPVFRRRTSTTQAANDLLTNSVPALVPSADGALWFGTALGVTRWQDGQFTPIPFTREVTVRDNVATLEAFFQAVAEAIFAARPLTTVAIGNVSFIDTFGRPLVKEDLVFSAIEDRRGRLWVGTLGGGIRRIEALGTGFQDTLHLTRLGVTRREARSGERTTVAPQGLGSNIIFALEEAPDGSLWAATDEGVSHIQEAAGAITITNFSALDGLALPVRDVAVSPDGTVWLATAGGMFRLTSQAGVIQGSVRDPTARPVAGVDVTIPGTAVRTVTDATGRFTLARLPVGLQRVRIESEGAVGGPFIPAALERTVEVTEGGQSLAPIVLVPRAPARMFDPATGGQVRFPAAPEAILDLPAGAAHVPPGTTPALHLTLLPPASLPQPLPEDFTAGAAADLQPAPITFNVPVRLTLPNQGALPPGRLVALLRFNPATRQYERAGYGRVSADGSVITTISGGLEDLTTVVFAVTPATAAARLEALGGNAQEGTVGTALPDPLRLQVQDGEGQGIAGVALTFMVTRGDGSLSATSQVTDADGHAAITWTLGPQTGRQEVTVVASGLLGSPLTLTATAHAVTSVGLERIAGNGQTGAVGTALPVPLRVAVVNRDNNNPVPNTAVTFTARAEGGEVRPLDTPGPAASILTVQTNAQGQAAVIALLGEGAGEQRFTAEVPGPPPVTFTAMAVAGPVTRLEAVDGDGEEVTVNTALPLVALATDSFTNPVADLPVTFRLRDPRQGTVSPARGRTDPQGRATTTLTPTMVGPIQVIASSAGLGAEFNVMVVEDETAFRLVLVAGNTQSGQPGEVLPAPLVVRLENQLGVPVADAAITAVIRRGVGTLLESLPPAARRRAIQTTQVRDCPLERQGGQVIARTNAAGEACFFLQVGRADEEEEDIEVAVAARDLSEVAPIRFLAIVGEIDTPDIPLDVALNATGDRLFVADRRSGVQIIDVSDPTAPRLSRTANLDGTEVRLQFVADPILGDRLYVGTNFPLRIYVCDTARNVCDAESLLGRLQFTAPTLQRHGIAGMAVQGDFAYVVTDARTANAGTLQVIDISDINPLFCPSLADAGTPLPSRPRGIAVAGNFAYVPAGEAGLLIFDVSTPTAPTPLPPLAGTFFSDITLANGMAYVVETRRDTETGSEQHLFTVLDLSNPTTPQRRGEGVMLPMVTQVAEVAPTIAVDARFAYLAQFALGLQALDISNRDAPRLVGRVDTPSQALRVTLNPTTVGGFLYVSDQIFGVQVIRGPGADTTDSDADGVIDFFDAFPTEANESQDTDGDRLGNNADSDDDNDGFSDLEERQASPPTDPLDPQSFPLRIPPSGVTTLVIDAASAAAARDRNGTADAPYRSLSEALRVVRQGRAPQVDTLLVQPGVYSPLTTQERFPLDLSQVTRLTLRSSEPGLAIIDAGFTGDVVVLDASTAPQNEAQVTIEGFTITHGAHGFFIRGVPAGHTAALVVRQNRLVENIFAGMSMSGNAHVDTRIVGNIVAQNGQEGIGIFERSIASITENVIDGNGDTGIVVGIDAMADIRDNRSITGNGHDGIRIVDKSVATIHANTIRSNGSFDPDADSARGCSPIGHGILVADSTATITANPAVTGNRLDGIVLEQNATALVTDNVIEANGLVSRFDRYGVRIQDLQETADEITIARNTIRNNPGGIVAANAAVALVIMDNTISRRLEVRDLREGIRVQGVFGMPPVTIMGNNITGYDDGLSLAQEPEQATVRIASNWIRESVDAGIDLLVLSSAEIIDNTLTDNGRVGIRLQGFGATPMAIVTQNYIADNVGEGLEMSQLRDTTITGNTIERNGGQSNLLIEEGSTVRVQDNLLRAHRSGDGVRIACPAVVELSGGEIAGNAAHGIALGPCFTNTLALATIACTGETMVIARNAGVGILVEEGAVAQIDPTQIIFDDNAAGDIAGSGQIRMCPE